jgi:hypothetical protein
MSSLVDAFKQFVDLFRITSDECLLVIWQLDDL